MRKIKFLILLVSIFATTFAIPVSAQGPFPPVSLWTNHAVEMRPDLGPKVLGLEPGVAGYKVFNPGAITITPISSISNSHETMLAAATIYRSGYTDAYGTCCTWNLYGSHTSDSDLFESQIWADGYLKYQSQTGWMASCSNRTSGSRAHCNTSFTGWYQTIYAETKHHFHTSGYVDSNFTTGDTF